jgi:hypothetical protein
MVRGIRGFTIDKATGKHGRLRDKQLTMSSSSSSRTARIIKSLRIKWTVDITCIEETINEQYFVYRTPQHKAAQT